MFWHHYTWQRSARRCLMNLAVLVFDLLTCTSYMFHPPGQTLEIGAFPSMVQFCGTFCQLTCEHLTCCWTPLMATQNALNYVCLLIAHLLPRRKLRFINVIIIIIIIKLTI